MSTYKPETTEEAEFLSSYDPTRFAPVAVTADVVCLTIRSGRLSVLLVQRGGFPYQGSWALPGGFVEPDEDLAEAALRELMEETGVETFPGHLEQLGTYGSPLRDPRMRVVSVAHLAFVPNLPSPEAGSDAAASRFWAVDDLGLWGAPGTEDAPELAFDHAQVLRDAVERARGKLEYSPLATAFVEDTFTIGELRRVYEAVWGTELDPANFHRKVAKSTKDFVVAVEGSELARGGGRPAQLYRRGTARLLHPAMLRPETKES